MLVVEELTCVVIPLKLMENSYLMKAFSLCAGGKRVKCETMAIDVYNIGL